MDYTSLVNLTFGKSIAESEVDKLNEYFVTTQAYINAKNEDRRKTYYVGHRGAGKSALLNKLASDFQRENKSIVLEITPHDFSYELFKRREHDYGDVRSVYAAVWHYTLVVELFKRTVAFFDSHTYFRTNRENINTLRKYLVGKGLHETDNLLDVFFSFLRDATVKKLTGRLKNIQNDSVHGDRELIRFLNLSEIHAEIRALESVAEGHPIYLFIDELDTGWDNSREAQNFIYGLFYAVREIQKLRNIVVFVSLRSDMYNDLSSLLPDPEKMRDDIERFFWNEKTLTSLIEYRISAYAKKRGLEEDAQRPIEAVFETGVLKHIISHSLHRPREVIQFCNETINEVGRLVDKTSDLPNKITFDIVKAVEPQFSLNRFNDLCDEYKHQYPGLKTFLSNFEHSPEFYYAAAFYAKLEDAMLQTLDKLGTDLWLHEYLDNARKLLDILFEIGFVKLYSQMDSRYLAYYESSFISTENIKQLKIHDVFVSALKCYGTP